MADKDLEADEAAEDYPQRQDPYGESETADRDVKATVHENQETEQQPSVEV